MFQFFDCIKYHYRRELKSLKLFEWVDGPLVESMLSGDHLLVDEISLAEDSVLERLNSVLELEKNLVIPDKMSMVGYTCTLPPHLQHYRNVRLLNRI